MIKSLYNSIKELAYQEYLASLREAQLAEDPEVLEIVEKAEECPICEEEESLRAYIRDSIITREIKRIIIHCTGTSPKATVTSILNYWKNVLKWINPGYHIIYPEVGFTVLADFNSVTNGVKGFNSTAINLSYIGGIDDKGKTKDTRTESQTRLLRITVEELMKKFPNAVIELEGHNAFTKAKACPSFNVKTNF